MAHTRTHTHDSVLDLGILTTRSVVVVSLCGSLHGASLACGTKEGGVWRIERIL